MVFAGIVLLVLGIGNWYTGSSRLDRYRGLLAEGPTSQPGVGYREFRHLTAAMNETLLNPLRDGAGQYQRIQAKVDFYRVAESTGKIFFLIGLLSVGAGVANDRRQLSGPRV